MLFYLDDLSLEDCAEICAIPVGTVKSRLYRARRLLRDRLTEKGSPAMSPMTRSAGCRDRCPCAADPRRGGPARRPGRRALRRPAVGHRAALPDRTRLAFRALITFGLAWVGYGGWALPAGRPCSPSTG